MSEIELIKQLLMQMLCELPFFVIAVCYFLFIRHITMTNKEIPYKDLIPYFKEKRYKNFNFKQFINDYIPRPILIALGAVITVYFIMCLCTWNIPDFQRIGFIMAGILLMTIFQFFKIEDAVVFTTILFLGCFSTHCNGFTGKINILLVLLTFIIAFIIHSPRVIKHFITNKKNKLMSRPLVMEDISMSKYIPISFIIASTYYFLTCF